MTVKELISILSGFLEDTIIAHEKYMQHKYESKTVCQYDGSRICITVEYADNAMLF